MPGLSKSSKSLARLETTDAPLAVVMLSYFSDDTRIHWRLRVTPGVFSDFALFLPRMRLIKADFPLIVRRG